MEELAVGSDGSAAREWLDRRPEEQSQVGSSQRGRPDRRRRGIPKAVRIAVAWGWPPRHPSIAGGATPVGSSTTHAGARESVAALGQVFKRLPKDPKFSNNLTPLYRCS